MSSLAQANFGVGLVSFAPPAGAVDPTPIYIAELQEVQVDYSATEVDLDGPNGFAIARAFTQRKLDFKAKFAKLTGGLVAATLDGSTSTTGSKIMVSETGVVTTGAVTVSGSATFVDNIAVRDAAGNVFSKVASAPTGNQYTVAAGVYTFNTTLNGTTLRFIYTKTQTAGKTVTLTNVGMGLATTYKVELYNDPAKNAGQTCGMDVAAVTIPKLSLPFKNTGFTIPDLSFSAMDDGLGNVATFYSAS